MKRRSLPRVLIGIVIALIIYLFIPLSSDDYTIPVDQKMLEAKKDYLENLNSEGDSLQPNIIWIIVDDLSYTDTDLYMDGPVSTPNLKKLAKEGALFTNAYVTSPVCSPSRAAIMTGRYNQRFGYENQIHHRYLRNRMEYYGFKYFVDSGPWRPKYMTSVPNEEFIENMGLPKSEITLAEILKNKGYATAYIGKWHLGKKDENSPTEFGFDKFYGFYNSHSLYVPENTSGFIDQKISEDWTDQYIWKDQRNGLNAIRRNNQIIEEDRYLTTAISDESIDFISNSQNKPFYLVASYNAPHTPLQAPEKYVNQFSNEQNPIKRVHYAMIKSLDDEIGRLVQFLKDSNLADNTLIFLVSDNGGAEYNLTTENGKYKGGKITNLEGGVKVPMIMKWPGKITRGTKFNKPVHVTDIFATSAKAANVELPSDRVYDGIDLHYGVETSDYRRKHIYFKMGTNGAIRDKQYKMVWNEVNGDTVLFDLNKDPYEDNDLFGTLPVVQSNLSNAYTSWSEEIMVPSWPPMIYYHWVDKDGKEYFFEE
jgi:arylsulfatase A-like enzyme